MQREQSIVAVKVLRGFSLLGEKWQGALLEELKMLVAARRCGTRVVKGRRRSCARRSEVEDGSVAEE
jgi:hypothetical protein